MVCKAVKIIFIHVDDLKKSVHYEIFLTLVGLAYLSNEKWLNLDPMPKKWLNLEPFL